MPRSRQLEHNPPCTPEEARRVVIRIVPAKLPRRLAQPIRSQMPRGKLRSPRRDPSYAPICGDPRATPNASEPPISDTVGENAPKTPQLYTVMSSAPTGKVRASPEEGPALPARVTRVLLLSLLRVSVNGSVTKFTQPAHSPVAGPPKFIHTSLSFTRSVRCARPWRAAGARRPRRPRRLCRSWRT